MSSKPGVGGAADDAERSRATAAWLFAVAALVFAMVVVGGATRLTDSGLSITEWRPVTGAVPPLSQADWQSEFAKYRTIPEYQRVNAGMSLEQFKTIYWWEWGHRFLGRLIGLAYGLPFVVLLALRRIPRRLLPHTTVLLALGGLQGFIGWWMVSSGLSERVDVAPERLTTHLGLALVIFMGLVWTGLEAWRGPQVSTRSAWRTAAAGLLALTFGQILLGGLVAGNDAGLVHADWPLMSGRLVPEDYDNGSIWMTAVHGPAATQLHHRLGAYLLFAGAIAMALAAWRGRAGQALRGPALTFAGLVTAQAALGIATLVSLVPLALGVLHQAGAVLVLLSALLLFRAALFAPAAAPQARRRFQGPVIASVSPGQ